MAAQILFFYFAGMILAGAVAAIASPNLIYSALSLLLTFIHIAGIYVLLNAEFVAAVQVIVYAGAILVLYLFVLMLFNPRKERHYLHGQLPIGLFLGAVLIGLMMLTAFKSKIIAEKGSFTVQAVRSAGHTESIGKVLYTDYVFPFEISSFILLVAMFGAILLAGRRKAPSGKRVAPERIQNGETLDETVKITSHSSPTVQEESVPIQARGSVRLSPEGSADR
ncbi:MAG: NADH-quinone oxidoreductase subunit J [Candidatus Manganitrophaceae bacterium]